MSARLSVTVITTWRRIERPPPRSSTRDGEHQALFRAARRQGQPRCTRAPVEHPCTARRTPPAVACRRSAQVRHRPGRLPVAPPVRNRRGAASNATIASDAVVFVVARLEVPASVNCHGRGTMPAGVMSPVSCHPVDLVARARRGISRLSSLPSGMRQRPGCGCAKSVRWRATGGVTWTSCAGSMPQQLTRRATSFTQVAEKRRLQGDEGLAPHHCFGFRYPPLC